MSSIVIAVKNFRQHYYFILFLPVAASSWSGEVHGNSTLIKHTTPIGTLFIKNDHIVNTVSIIPKFLC